MLQFFIDKLRIYHFLNIHLWRYSRPLQQNEVFPVFLRSEHPVRQPIPSVTSEKPDKIRLSSSPTSERLLLFQLKNRINSIPILICDDNMYEISMTEQPLHLCAHAVITSKGFFEKENGEDK